MIDCSPAAGLGRRRSKRAARPPRPDTTSLSTATPPAPFAIRRRFPRGSLIVEADSLARTVYLIRSGQVRVFMLREDGQETTTAVLGAGQLCGIGPLLGRSTYHAFAQALSEVEVWALLSDELRTYLLENPPLAKAVLGALARRLALAQGLLRDVALLPVAQRIPDALERVDGLLEGEPVQLTHEALAGLVGTRRETVSRAFAAARSARGETGV